MKIVRLIGIKGKLLFLVGFAIAVFSGLVFYANHTIQRFAQTVEYLGSQRIPLTQEIGDIREAANGVPRFMWLALAQTTGSAERKKSIEKAKLMMGNLSESVGLIEKFQLVDKAREQLNQIKAVIPNLAEVVEAGTAALGEGTAESDKFAKNLLMEKMPPFALKISGSVSNLAKIVDEKNRAILADSEAQASSSVRMLLLVSSVVGICFAGFGIIFASYLAKTLNAISRMLGESSNQVASAAHQVSSASQGLASTSAEQASSVEETSASLEEMTGMVESTVRHAESGLHSVEGVMTASESGNQSMKNLAAAMAEVMESNKRIEALVKVINEIGEKTKIIDEIVFQTKLLSFNASVEAERAGEHGRGFAVVAREVGNLAQMSGKAALEISSIVKSSTKEAQEIVSENKFKVENGNKHVQETAKILREIQTSAESVVSGSRQILSASKEQSAGIKQISIAMENINKATQETVATSEESASAGEELSAQAQHLDSLVLDLNCIISGDKAESKGLRSSNSAEAASENVLHLNKERKGKSGAFRIQRKENLKKSNVIRKTASSSTAISLDYDDPRADGDGWKKL